MIVSNLQSEKQFFVAQNIYSLDYNTSRNQMRQFHVGVEVGNQRGCGRGRQGKISEQCLHGQWKSRGKLKVYRTPGGCNPVIRLVLTLACNTPTDTSLCCAALLRLLFGLSINEIDLSKPIEKDKKLTNFKITNIIRPQDKTHPAFKLRISFAEATARRSFVVSCAFSSCFIAFNILMCQNVLQLMFTFIFKYYNATYKYICYHLKDMIKYNSRFIHK